ncbi:MAG: glycosyltransferase family 9 protein [Bacteroidia bacterium]
MKVLVIQTAFIGDVILATPVLEKLHQHFPDVQIDFLLRKGNESLFTGHPYLNRVIVWDKKSGKFSGLMKIISQVRKEKYDKIINLHRFASSGLVTLFSGAKEKIGFDKNPLSFCYTGKIKHVIGDGRHEAERNIELVSAFTDNKIIPPKLYPLNADYEFVKPYKSLPYICIAPASVWFTKQYPPNKWVEFINSLNGKFPVYLLGAGSDRELCDNIIKSCNDKEVKNLSGNLSFLQTAALMRDAKMNYVNDSAPMHIASAMNAHVTAIFCSTIPAFGFGPLSAKSFIVETDLTLDCRPCGLHGHKECPNRHFLCANSIKAEKLLNVLDA